MYSLSDIRRLIKSKLAEGSDDFFTTSVINDQINTVLSELATEALCYFETAKLHVPEDTDGINCPTDFIDIVVFAVNNQMYKRISFQEIAQYMGDDAVYPNDFIYYVRNHKLITLSGLKTQDELTIYYNAHFKTLVDDEDTLPAEFDNLSFIQTLTYGVCWKLKEMDEDFKAAMYFRDIYLFGLNNLKKINLRRKRGSISWKLAKADISSPLILSGNYIYNRDSNKNG